nr:hypothetical protein Iba_chr10dCG15390 [Ipomoea batatas]
MYPMRRNDRGVPTLRSVVVVVGEFRTGKGAIWWSSDSGVFVLAGAVNSYFCSGNSVLLCLKLHALKANTAVSDDGLARITFLIGISGFSPAITSKLYRLLGISSLFNSFSMHYGMLQTVSKIFLSPKNPSVGNQSLENFGRSNVEVRWEPVLCSRIVVLIPNWGGSNMSCYVGMDGVSSHTVNGLLEG